jgi:SRSO17 transposase
MAMELVEQQPGSWDAWDEAFLTFHARFAPFFHRREVRERSAHYLRGLLGPVERKNGWQLAEAVGAPDPQGMQRLLYAARWDADAVRDELASSPRRSGMPMASSWWTRPASWRRARSR